jgi:hypothetical protein
MNRVWQRRQRRDRHRPSPRDRLSVTTMRWLAQTGQTMPSPLPVLTARPQEPGCASPAA